MTYKVECGMVPVYREVLTEAIDFALEFCSDSTITDDGRVVGWVSNKKGLSRARCYAHPSANTDEFHAFGSRDRELNRKET